MSGLPKLQLTRPQNFSNNSNDGNINFLLPLMRKRQESGFFHSISSRLSSDWLSLGSRLNFICLVSSREFDYFTAKPAADLRKYRAITVIMQTFFNMQKLESFDLCTAFEEKLRPTKFNDRSNNSSQIILTRLNQRHNLNEMFENNMFAHYRFLIKQAMLRRKAPIINFIERWFGESNYDLESLGLTRTTRCGDLSTDEYIKLFKFITDRPDYPNSTFARAAEQVERCLDNYDE